MLVNNYYPHTENILNNNKFKPRKSVKKNTC